MRSAPSYEELYETSPEHYKAATTPALFFRILQGKLPPPEMAFDCRGQETRIARTIYFNYTT